MMEDDKAMGDLGYEREDHDFYETPEWVTDVLLRNVFLKNGVIWEPAAGNGAIAEKLKVAYPTKYVHTTDIVQRDYTLTTVIDFLQSEWISDQSISIVTNPPYGKLTDQFIERALNITETSKGIVAMLMRNEFDCAASRRKFFADHPAFTKKIVLLKRPRWYEYKPGDAGPRHNYAWYIWDWTNTSLPTVVYDK